jgi:hypothetical protein
MTDVFHTGHISRGFIFPTIPDNYVAIPHLDTPRRCTPAVDVLLADEKL